MTEEIKKRLEKINIEEPKTDIQLFLHYILQDAWQKVEKYNSNIDSKKFHLADALEKELEFLQSEVEKFKRMLNILANLDYNIKTSLDHDVFFRRQLRHAGYNSPEEFKKHIDKITTKNL